MAVNVLIEEFTVVFIKREISFGIVLTKFITFLRRLRCTEISEHSKKPQKRHFKQETSRGDITEPI